METWTVKRILEWIEDYLAHHGDSDPRLSAQWLVGEALGLSRIQLFTQFDRPLTPEERDVLRDYTKRRAVGEPLQYITGSTDFRFITIRVEPGVLIPRPETEVLVSSAIAGFPKADGCRELGASSLEAAPSEAIGDTCEDPEIIRAIDLCCGTGCIACSIAHEVKNAHVIATDIDPKAVDLAQRNIDELGLGDSIRVIECDLGDGIDEEELGTFDLVVSNPPYIPTDVLATLDSEVVDYENSLALDGGSDGLDVLRRILPFAMRALAPSGLLAVELHETTLDAASALARDEGFATVKTVADLAGKPRVLLARKSG